MFKFDYQKRNTFEFVRCSKNNVRDWWVVYLVNLVKALLILMFVCSKQKIGYLSSITYKWTCSLDVRIMIFEFVRCPTKWFDPSLSCSQIHFWWGQNYLVSVIRLFTFVNWTPCAISYWVYEFISYACVHCSNMYGLAMEVHLKSVWCNQHQVEKQKFFRKGQMKK